MNDPHEDYVDTVLAGLRNIEAASGMEDRVLATLQCAEDSHVRDKTPRRLPTWCLSWQSYAMVAGVLAVAAGGLLYPRSPVDRDAHSRDVAQREPMSQRSVVAQSWLSPDHVLVRVPQVSQRHGIRLRAFAGSHVSEARHGAPAPIAHADDRSFPAPPLPLTEQERLLLRLVRHEPPTQLAALTAPAREAAFQRDKDEVTTFFAPPAPLVDPPDPQAQPSAYGQR